MLPLSKSQTAQANGGRKRMIGINRSPCSTCCITIARRASTSDLADVDRIKRSSAGSHFCTPAFFCASAFLIASAIHEKFSAALRTELLVSRVK